MLTLPEQSVSVYSLHPIVGIERQMAETVRAECSEPKGSLDGFCHLPYSPVRVKAESS